MARTTRVAIYNNIVARIYFDIISTIALLNSSDMLFSIFCQRF